MSMICSSLQWLLNHRAREAHLKSSTRPPEDNDDGLPDWVMEADLGKSNGEEGPSRAEMARLRLRSGCTSVAPLGAKGESKQRAEINTLG